MSQPGGRHRHHRRRAQSELEDIVNHNADRIGPAAGQRQGLRPRGGTTEGREPLAAVEDSGGRSFVAAVTGIAGLFTLAAGVWALASPSSFAEAVAFPNAEHFLHDLGAFQIGIGVTLLLALGWRDGLALALTGFLVGNSIHAVNHALDQDLGGHAADPWALGLVSLLVAAALVVRLRELGWVVGEVGVATTSELAPFVRQKTALLTSYRRDGRPVGTPLSIAVDGDHAYIRSYEKAWKTVRIRNHPEVEIAPSTRRGKPTGPGIHAVARRLEGEESRYAGRLIARKHPMLQRIVVPFSHLAGRGKFGRTVHFELVPVDR
jgi:PPOX class probable F420-dependent enzyme